MKSRQIKIIILLSILALSAGITPAVSAMHIMEGYLPPRYVVAWGILCIPFLAAGYFSLKKTLQRQRKTLTILAMAGAYMFLLSSLKIPSVTGSCSHMTGSGLGALLFGPSTVGILGIIVLLFQAILLAHGGITTLGANTFSMAIAGPFAAYAVYRICRKLKVNKKVCYFLAALVGDLFTYCVTSMQLAIAFPSETGGVSASFLKFLAVFAPTQIPLAVIEGLLTVITMIALETYAKNELSYLGFDVGVKINVKE
ncbi:energy-coupling factor ABC transporter permease [Parasporobacterium paucivorans]|uniref:Cobalt transport protein CbiM n=1 Tax=Parasporobacterium paucivorans DSM 15970 TaxID=1122934 RepID=A0A1M6DSJ1_9FIRM|nr:energy-coupling factor ABC transporter permease [Parasporobacterium paucivorans]SHI75978.1 cobalt/nickel transport system permease protein [Parasporobacterium paucivorans DSM 15970]